MLLGEIWRAVQRIEERLNAGGGPAPAGKAGAKRNGAGGDGVAPDSDLDGKWGDPEVKRRDPPRWSGDTYVGARYSECPSEYLDTLAGFLDWQAGKDEAKGDAESAKFARYKRSDARRARGWARRNEGRAMPAPAPRAPPGFGSGSEDDAAF